MTAPRVTRDELVAMLRRLAEGNLGENNYGDRIMWCADPDCRRDLRHGHYNDCQLGPLLARLDVEERDGEVQPAPVGKTKEGE